MVIETNGNVIYVSGSLRTNQWPTIKAAAYLILREIPNGVVLLDCAGLRTISAEGRETFVDALRDMEARRLPLRVANLPERLQAQLEAVSGGRLHAHLAETPETARITQIVSSAEWWHRLLGTA